MSFTDGIPWAIAVIGWGFTHIFSEARERRKEMRSQIDKLHEQIYKIEQDGRNFHCNDKFDATKAGDLISKLNILERIIMRISILSIDNLNIHLITLRRAISLNNFDRSVFITQDQTSEILQDVFGACQTLEDEIERQYRERYPSKFPYIKW